MAEIWSGFWGGAASPLPASYGALGALKAPQWGMYGLKPQLPRVLVVFEHYCKSSKSSCFGPWDPGSCQMSKTFIGGTVMSIVQIGGANGTPW